MTVYTFSTRTKKPDDEEAIQQLKRYCQKHHLNFSGVVINVLKKYVEKLSA